MMPSVSVVVPTYQREKVLLDTLDFLVGLASPPSEILVIDQTEAHEPETVRSLTARDLQGQIRWIKRTMPSIPQAMNCGLLAARHEVVLFLDDDIRPEEGLVARHACAHATYADVIVAGRVIQPWEEGQEARLDAPFHFASTNEAWISEFMGGNFSVRRAAALALGGFDENFVRVAYRFEAEFAHRAIAMGARIFFEPRACIHHLKVSAGGTRSYGEHLTTVRPDHAVGAYYYILRTWNGWRSLKDFLFRPLRSIVTRHHLRRPWFIPNTLISELRAMLWALSLFARGARHIDASASGVIRDA